MATIIAYIVAFLAVFGSGAGLSYKLTSDHYRSEQLTAVTNAEAEKERKLTQAFDSERDALNMAHAEELKNNVIVREVPKYVTKIQRVKSDCSYSLGTVRLLDDAAGKRVPENNTALPAPDDAAASDITEYAGIKYTHELLSQYNLWMIKHNALIDYLHKN